jgi:hypothetical protein
MRCWVLMVRVRPLRSIAFSDLSLRTEVEPDPARSPEDTRRALAYIPEKVDLYGTFSGMENLFWNGEPGLFADLGGNKWQEDRLRDFLCGQQ